MISLPFRRSRRFLNIAALYGMIVAQARSPAFYRAYGVPDTVEGRLDMVVLHLALVLRRLSAGSGPMTFSPPGQLLFDRFCQDIDDNFREMGVGDLAVPKQMQRVAGMFYGRAQAYESALAANDRAALEAAVVRNIYGAASPTVGASRLAAYMFEAAARLERQPVDAIERAAFDFPDPEAALGAAEHEHSR
jgi:cytochrome b pre-mRNA-processing protein 3